MIALEIITILLGFTFAVFGYLIYFKKKYNLINNFMEDYKSGRKDESYAKLVGKIEFYIGISLLFIGVILVFFK
jgi:hypothetical protein